MYNDPVSIGGNALFHRIATAFSTWGQRALVRITAGIKHMQYTRMIGVLHSMTDTQLAEINVSRKDIRLEAARIVNIDL